MGCDVGGITPGLGNAATAAASTWFAVITAPDDGEELLGVAFERGNANLLLLEAVAEPARLPDGDSQIIRLYVFGPSGLKDYVSATLCCKI